MWTKHDNKSNLKKRKGISLITMIITIVVAIILTVVIIMVSTKENAIGSARANKVLSNRDTIESEIKMYVSNVQSDTRGYFTTLQIISGAAKQRETENKFLKDGTIKYRIVACESVVAGVNDEEVSEKQIYKLDSEKYKEKTGYDLPAAPNSHSAWYVDGNGTVYVAFDSKDNIPKSLKSGSDETMLVDNSLLNIYTVITDLEVCEEFDDTPIDPDKDKDDDEKQDDIIIPDTTEYGWFTWTVSNGQVTITGFNETKISEEGYYPTTVVFPKTIQGNPVVAIRDDAFRGRNKIEKLYVSEGITSLGHRTFRDCTGLKEVYLPSTLSYISHWTDGDATFYNCNQIQDLMIPQYMVSNDRPAGNMFQWSRGSINRVRFVGEITSIGNNAFNYMSALSNIVIPKTVTSIGSNAFNSCNSLPKISIPDSVVTIGNAAYINCTSVTSLKIGKGVVTISDDAFRGCSSLPTAIVSEGVQSLGHRAFRDCTALTEVYLPSTLTYISQYSDSDATFYNCKNINKITVPQYVISKDRAATDMFAYSRNSIKIVEFSGTITYIGPRAFDGFTGLENLSNKTVLIPNTVTSIGSYAFRNCTSISSITIPDGVETIEVCAFQNNVNATRATFGKGTKVIADDAFRNCSKLPNIMLKEGITSIGHRAFRDCAALTEVYLPSTLTYISQYSDSDATFYNCKNITKITIPQYIISKDRAATDMFAYSRNSIKTVEFSGEITYIGPRAFDGFTGLENLSNKTVLIPNTVTSIGAYAFRNCTSISSITIPDGVITIEVCAFQNNTNATSATFGEGTKVIADEAFRNCSKLPNIILKEGITSIGHRAFRDCIALTEVYLPSTLTYISQYSDSDATFYNCKNITKITIPQYIISKDRAATDMFAYSRNSIKTVEFSGEITYIGPRAFDGFTGLENLSNKTVLIPNTVTSIGAYAFRNCTSISSITIPDGVITIEVCAFQNNTNATSATFGEGTKVIADEAFRNCSKLPNIILKEGITSIGHRAFRDCAALTEVYLPSTLTYISQYSDSDATFYNCTNINKITVPQYIVSSERAATDMFAYCRSKIKTVEFSGVITYIGPRAFDGFTGLDNLNSKTVLIPNTVTSIGSYAFRNCSSVKGISIPDGIVSIGEYAFYNNSSATNITLGKGVQSIANDAFRNCTSLPNIILREGIKSIGHRAFRDCTNLTEVYLPSTLTYISQYSDSDATFYNCNKIEKITVPQYIVSSERAATDMFAYSRNSIKTVEFSGVITYIGARAFDGFTGLDNLSSTTVLIPETVTSIGAYAFRNCSSVSSITIPDSIISIGEYAFYNNSSATNVTFGKGLQSIANDAFRNCTKLSKIILGEGVTSISHRAFRDCIALTEVYLPSTLTYISQYSDSDAAFYNCTNINKITVPQYITGDRGIGSMFNYCRGKIKEIYLNDNVTSITSNGLSGISDATVYYKNNIPSGTPWGGSNISVERYE